MTYVSSKDRKSILWHYGRGHTILEMSKWSRFQFISAEDMRAVIDQEYPTAPPAPTPESRREEVAEALFPNAEDYERDRLMSDLIRIMKDELT